MATGAAGIGAWTKKLAEKTPTPGGGAAAAVCGAIGAAAGAMAAIYTTRKKDEETGVAEKARALSESLKQTSQKCMEIADEDEEAYAALQASWKDSSMTAEQKAKVEATALDVPVRLLKLCHAEALKVHEFIPSCNPNIVSDAKVAIHLMAGAGRAAYQTVLVNNPPDAVKAELQPLLQDLKSFEEALL
ncbi:hypothetical protein GUITHDRAFT_155909 [Guillardia theta CCMP2712]|uniref:Cyclodeaminase/cyclohydrolase domain-containing protein n=2 Tax=Guillardia theta TaxID=55529 RepID=L1IDH0_GUITC|nr:hypothetical protein GUITHDRAFT_155909 [Guillardia theta CCMP2712]EKX33870.1 hypothetical protein GUITHDRAFT_155909 [Guillardia theta CCMP2712]|eukprot:XP_005820850.1 hypothetical protein GUITHDRAFT_155909 [Guillardia theta CCMP2712]